MHSSLVNRGSLLDYESRFKKICCKTLNRKGFEKLLAPCNRIACVVNLYLINFSTLLFKSLHFLTCLY